MGGLVEQVSAAALSGMVLGSAIGLLAAGMALVFRVQRHINVAVVELAGFGAVMAYVLRVELALAQVYAGLLAVGLTVLLALLIERLLVRPLLDAGQGPLLLGGAGVALLLIGVAGLVTGGEGVRLGALLADGQPGWLGEAGAGSAITLQELLLLVAAVAAAAGLWFLLSRSLRGKVLRATSADPLAARLAGVPVEHAGMLAWGTAGALAGTAGVGLAPLLELVPGTFTAVALVPALAALLLAGRGAVLGAMLAGVLLGVLSEVVAITAPVTIPSPAVLLGFLLLLLGLLVVPQRLVGQHP